MKIASRASSFDVAIVGGGFSGTMVAVQLLRSAPAGSSIAIVEAREQLGLGRAYDTQCAGHVLNVPAGSMSALPDEPDHFLQWCERELDVPVTAGDFVERGLYGRYINSLYHSTLSAFQQAQCEKYHAEVVHLQPEADGVRITLADGTEISAHQVVLAIGGLPPGTLSRVSGAGDSYIANPWNVDIAPPDNSADPVLILGSGLTAVDTIMSLRKNNFSGPIVLLSRNGRLPQVHGQPASHGQPGHGYKALTLDDLQPYRTRLLMRAVRQEIKKAQESGTDWRAVMDSLRPVYDKIWSAMPVEERRRFLRHARSFWEIHRHRMAPKIGDLLREMVADGTVKVMAGSLIAVRNDNGSAEVVFRERGGTRERKLTVSKVVNCTGHGTDVRNTKDRLLRSLLENGIAVPDPLFMGLEVSADGAVVDREGRASQAVYVIGSLRKGILWETTAVRELREQAFALASHIGSALASSRTGSASRAAL